MMPEEQKSVLLHNKFIDVHVFGPNISTINYILNNMKQILKKQKENQYFLQSTYLRLKQNKV
jgi:hypothetical protein